MMALLDLIRTCRLFRPLDVQAACLLARLDRSACPELPLLAALTSWATGQGHTCLPLSEVAGLLTEMGMEGALCADPSALRTSLLASPAVGRPSEIRPLVLDEENHLFLFRLDHDEEVVAKALRQRAIGIDVFPPTAKVLLDRLFPATKGVDWQRAAAALALCKRFVILSGGPGTGKTYTVARILALLTSLAPRPLRIALAAPTGKAALRLQESIQNARAALPEELIKAIPEQAQTLHRLLGFQPLRSSFLHHAGNLLHLDLLILDEASMIDVPLMAATLAALPSGCRVILLGDRDQLASVEAGNLFGDLCGDGHLHWSIPLRERLQPHLHQPIPPPTSGKESGGLLADSLVILRASHRFRAGSGIGELAQAVNAGDPAHLEAILNRSGPDLHIEEATGPTAPTWLLEQIEQSFLPLFTADTPQAALEMLGQSRILCALREGPTGVEGINRLAETLFRRRGDIPPASRLYRGLPVLVLRNDYGLGLFNGDTGILWPNLEGILQAWFPQASGSIRPVALARLPAWQTSYALTVHKAQGSEFSRILYVLPHEDAPLLSRELLYTGITRARNHLALLCRRELLSRIVQRQVVRYSGLGTKLGQDSRKIPSLRQNDR